LCMVLLSHMQCMFIVVNDTVSFLKKDHFVVGMLYSNY